LRRTTRRRVAGGAALPCLGFVLAALAAGCAALEEKPDLEAAREFDRFPIYWLGESFEGHDLSRLSGLEDDATAVGLVYGTCDVGGEYHSSCLPPLQLQIFPLCHHLDTVAINPAWKTRKVRGAPVGYLDGPVLFTRRVYVKVFRGEGSDRSTALRALEQLHSLNDVEPVITRRGQIPGPSPGVLEGESFCKDA
jgi:hypothetical protein